MPGVESKSKLPFGSLLKQVADQPVDWGTEFVDLPGGITGGVAQLVEIRFGEYKTGDLKGKQFCYFAGVVESPRTALSVKKIWKPSPNPQEAAKGKGTIEIIETKEVPTAGQRTSIMVPLCETKVKSGPNFGKVTTIAENVKTMRDELVKLGGEQCMDGVEDEAGLLALFAELKAPGGDPQMAPRFKFSTQTQDPSAKYPESGVWPHKWFGTKGLENYVRPDETANEVREAPKPGKNGAGKLHVPAPTEDHSDSNPDGAEDAPQKDDIPALLEAAKVEDDSGEPARARLLEIAVANGYTEEQFTAADWDAVEGMVAAPADDNPPEPDPEPAPEEVAPPAKGNVYSYQLLDPKTKKPLTDPKNPKKTRKPVQVEVVVLDAKGKTVNLKNLEDGKSLYAKVPWDQLLPA